MKVTISTSANSNPFLDADGLLNFVKVFQLETKINEFLKKNPDTQPETIFVAARRAKPVKYSAAQAAKEDFKYLAARAIKLAERKRVKPESLGRVAILLRVVEGLPAKLAADTKAAASAIRAHIKKSETARNKVSTKKGAVRDAENKVFEKSLDLLKEILTGEKTVKDTDIVEATSMFGKTLIVKLSATNFVSINKSDAAKFKAAKAS